MKKLKNRKVNVNERSRTHVSVLYINKEDVLLILEKNLSIINRYALIEHSRDFYDDGKEKPTHIHLWVQFFNKKSIKQVQELFYVFDEDKQKPCTVLSELCQNNHISQRYLLHLDDPQKAQYEFEEIISYNVDLSNIYDCYATDGEWEYECLRRMVDGEDKLELAREYGRDFIYHYFQFKTLCNDIKDDNFSRDLLARKLEE